MTAYLVDTHTFVWSRIQAARLSETAAALLTERSGRLVLSVASIWEIAIKTALGKLHVPDDLTAWDIELLDVRAEHAWAVRALPTVERHRDPFDRMLVAQAKIEGLDIISADPRFDLYDGVKRVW